MTASLTSHNARNMTNMTFVLITLVMGLVTTSTGSLILDSNSSPLKIPPVKLWGYNLLVAMECSLHPLDSKMYLLFFFAAVTLNLQCHISQDASLSPWWPFYCSTYSSTISTPFSIISIWMLRITEYCWCKTYKWGVNNIREQLCSCTWLRPKHNLAIMNTTFKSGNRF